MEVFFQYKQRSRYLDATGPKNAIKKQKLIKMIMLSGEYNEKKKSLYKLLELKIYKNGHYCCLLKTL
jgi:hypothetical protein